LFPDTAIGAKNTGAPNCATFCIVAESFDIAFSFSSIEHFDGGGKNHSGALRSLREIERACSICPLCIVLEDWREYNPR
jgi:hypothetical protein